MKFSEQKKTITPIIFISLGLLLLLGAKEFIFDGAIGNSNQMKVLEPEKMIGAPNFSLLDLDGKIRNLHDFQGKFVLLNFWDTW